MRVSSLQISVARLPALMDGAATEAVPAADKALSERQEQLSELEPEEGSRRAAPHLTIRYTQRLTEAGAVASVGVRGDAYDDALAEAPASGASLPR